MWVGMSYVCVWVDMNVCFCVHLSVNMCMDMSVGQCMYGLLYVFLSVIVMSVCLFMFECLYVDWYECQSVCACLCVYIYV